MTYALRAGSRLQQRNQAIRFGDSSGKVLLHSFQHVWSDVLSAVQSHGCTAESEVSRNQSVEPLAQRAEQKYLSAELIKFMRPTDTCSGNGLASLVTEVHKVLYCGETASVLPNGSCHSRGDHFDPICIESFPILDGVPALTPRDVDGDADTKYRENCLRPCRLRLRLQGAPSNPFAIHAISPFRWGQA